MNNAAYVAPVHCADWLKTAVKTGNLISNTDGVVMKDLVCSVSGGQTSGYMSVMLQKYYSDKFNISYTFANTGQEKEETLEFVERLDREYGLGIVWVEAVVHEGRKGTTHKIVDFDTASRNGEPFEAVIQKYGLPNKSYPHCTRELKLQPMVNYERETHPHGYTTAIGIRADEYRRVKNASNIIYPLIDFWITDKATVNSWWGKQPFNLELEEHQGNCKWCWKKSFRKLYRLALETPEVFEFPERMEELYSGFIPESQFQTGEPRSIFRSNTTTKQIIADAIRLKKESKIIDMLDIDDGCSESCEMYEAV